MQKHFLPPWMRFKRKPAAGVKKDVLEHFEENLTRIFNINGDDLSQDDIIIAVMGPTGSGKSSFIDTATTGDGAAVGHSMVSCTQDIGVVKYQLQGHSIVFVDTPGFDDTYQGDFEILHKIADWLQNIYKCDIKLAGILYLHPITNIRMTGTAMKNLNMFVQLCGKNAMPNVIIATTMWSDVSMDTGHRRQKELEGHFWKEMIDGGSKAFRYDNNYESAWLILDHILDPALDRQAVKLQKEMVDLELQLRNTDAGKALYDELEKFVQNRKDSLRKLHQRSTARNGDGDPYAERERELRAQIAVTIAEMERLSTSLGKRLFFSLMSPFYGRRLS